ncbi:hypothetical protein DSO57_1035159 [Entomophthora muscae]|uniref:Uncharacterized protein n=1 Tax=Entomophthora muscae TaxID=34485 RepID=A0ACC2TAN0_9FUNG|nr:hypothetical protein DSO57_1035159 [Entomophthora muscae]
MSKKEGASFVYKGQSFNFNGKNKAICQHHYKCDPLGCPPRLTTYGFTRFKEVAVGHNCNDIVVAFDRTEEYKVLQLYSRRWGNFHQGKGGPDRRTFLKEESEKEQ